MTGYSAPVDTPFTMPELLPGSTNLQGTSSQAHLLVISLTTCISVVFFRKLDVF